MVVEGCDVEETCLTGVEEEVVFLDSCASKALFILKDQSCLETFQHRIDHVKTTKAGETVETQGEGSYGDFTGVRVCNGAIKNLIGAGYLRRMGYGLLLLSVPKIVVLASLEVVIVAEYHENGMPFVLLSDLLDLPDISTDEGVEAMFSDDMGEDPVELLHRRAVHVSRSVLVEAYRRQAISGTKLGRKHMSKSFTKKLSKVLCKGCALSKRYTERPSQTNRWNN